MKIPSIDNNRAKVQPLINICCNLTRINPIDIDDITRKREIVQTRQMVMYYLKEFSPLNLSEIAWVFRKDHAVTLHSHKTIKNLIDTDIRMNSFHQDNEHQIKQLINIIFSYKKTVRKRTQVTKSKKRAYQHQFKRRAVVL